jgi:filamentous hemagglutinin family protein
MKNNNKIYPNLSGLAMALAGLFSGSVSSDIVTDGSLGPPAETLKGPDFKIAADKGRQAGTNLFHSFKIFNIHKGESSTFSGPANVKNIFSRVTGDSSSTIDGLLKSTIQGADFFIINPQGIFFGPDAKLELSGSFHASTANNIGFTDGTTFSVNNLDPNATLSVAAPQSFGFLGDNPAQISLDSANLSVQLGKEISLIGGNLDIVSSSASAPNGGVNIVSRIAKGKVPLTSPSDAEMGNDFQTGNYGNITMSIGTQLNTDGEGGTGIRIKAGRIVVDSGSLLQSKNLFGFNKSNQIIIVAGQLEVKGGSMINTDGVGGEGITIRADQFDLEASTLQSQNLFGFNQGNPINIDAKTLNLKSGSLINTDGADGVFSPDESVKGGMYIKAKNLIITGGSTLQSTNLFSNNEGYPIDITVNRIAIKDGSQIGTGTFADGKGGTINIEANEHIIITGENTATGLSGIFSNTFINKGKAGDITINAPVVEMRDGGTIGGGVLFGFGTAPNINIEAEKLIVNNEKTGALTMISTQNSAFTSQTPDQPVTPGNIHIVAFDSILITGFRSGIRNNNIGGDRDAGNILISSPQLTLTNQATIEGSTISSGQAADIVLNVDHLLVSNGAVINSSSGINTGTQSFSGVGGGGNIRITNAETVKLLNAPPYGCAICSTTLGSGNAGSVEINTEQLVITNSGINVETFASGQAGSVNIRAIKSIEVSGFGGITASTEAVNNQLTGLKAGNAGEINVKTPLLAMSGNVVISSSTIGDGDAKQVNINVDRLDLYNSAKIRSNSGMNGTGQGGTININSNQIDLNDPNTSISTNTLGFGTAGNIRITATQLNLGNQATISSSSSGTGDAGSIEIIDLNEFRSRQASVTTEATQADGGNITLRAEDLVFLKDSAITASVKQGGNGGNIDIDPVFTILDNSRIIAQAEDGTGGNIKITTDFLFASGNSIIDASSNTGINGQVIIEALDREVLSSVETLPATFLDATSILSKPCASRADRQSIQFVVREYEVLPQAPDVLQVHLPSLPPSGGVTNPGNTVTSVADATLHLSSAAGCTEQ